MKVFCDKIIVKREVTAQNTLRLRLKGNTLHAPLRFSPRFAASRKKGLPLRLPQNFTLIRLIRSLCSLFRKIRTANFRGDAWQNAILPRFICNILLYLQRVISLRRLAAKAVKGAARRGEAHGAYARKSAIFDGGSPHLNIKISERGGFAFYISPLSLFFILGDRGCGGKGETPLLRFLRFFKTPLLHFIKRRMKMPRDKATQ